MPAAAGEIEIDNSTTANATTDTTRIWPIMTRPAKNSAPTLRIITAGIACYVYAEFELEALKAQGATAPVEMR